MSYQQGSGTPRGFDRPKKAKAKQKSKSHCMVGSFAGEQSSQSSSEILGRTFSGLENLGDQSFAMAPFYQHFESWLKSLQTVLDDFETSKIVDLDERFTEERKRLFSVIETALMEERTNEISQIETIRGLNESKKTLFQADQEYMIKFKEISSRREQKVKSLIGVITIRQGELDDVVQSKSGFLEGITKTKAKKEEDVRSRLTVAKKELEDFMSTFAAEKEHIQDEYEKTRQEILKKIADDKKETERLEAEAQADKSTEIRRIACGNLAESIKALIGRSKSQPPTP
jgi:vacuolar-type H+-ATPase subunit I/STV1